MPKPSQVPPRTKQHLSASQAVAVPVDRLTPWQRSKRERLLRRERDEAVRNRVLGREQARLREQLTDVADAEIDREVGLDQARG